GHQGAGLFPRGGIAAVLQVLDQGVHLPDLPAKLDVARRRLRLHVGVHPGLEFVRLVPHQQMRGNCSPESSVTTRSPPTGDRMVTRPGCSATTVPMTAASRPSGCARMVSTSRSASSGGTTAMSFPSLATYRGSSPSISQAPRTSGRTGIDDS